MEDPKRAEISALKLQWRKIAIAHRRQQKLIQKLEEVETYLIRIESDLVKTQSEDKDDKQRLYHELKKKKRELDQFLDEVEEITAEDVDVVQEELVKRILDYSPHLVQSYGTIDTAMRQVREKEKRYHAIQQELQELMVRLESLIEKRDKVKGWGLWRFFLGQSPAGAITREIANIRSNAERVLEKNLDDEELTLMLQQLVGLSKNRWDFKLIDKHYVPIKDSVVRLEGQYRNALQVLREEKILLNERLYDWVDQG